MSELNPTVLIAEDDPVATHIMRAVLASGKHTLIFTADGRDALERARSHRPDLLLLDVQMPGMDGYAVCRALRADPDLAEMPVIMVTSLDDRRSRLDGLEAGADDFIGKPFDHVELAARVRTVLRLNRYRRLQEANRLRQELATAAVIQQQLLPRRLPEVPGLDLFGSSRPAAVVGGDYYDAIWTGGRLYFLIADVSGHDVSAALFVATARSTFRAILLAAPDVVALADAVNARMVEDAGDTGMFLTAALGAYSPATRELVLVNCGHPPPLLLSAAGIRRFEPAAPPLGVVESLNAAQSCATMGTGDLLALYTDGVVEASAADGEQFGRERLEGVMTGRRRMPLSHLARDITDAVVSFAGPALQDDATVVLLRSEA